jgi:integrating conjugative element membrane protein (TIGR03745 family)
LPTPIDPTIGGAPGGNWLNLIRGYIGDGAVILGLAIATIGLLWIAYTGVAKFNECRNGKAEWSELGVLGIVGAVVLLFMMFLLNEAATIIV